ncbi:MAG: nucleotidyltransferase domain-containing protein [Actinobacteria bacterium]|nr:nucleotidyltransferase domain-containing protein [Actinomycetota bacterium]
MDADANAPQTGSSPPRSATDQLPADLAGLLKRLSDGLEALYGERYRGLVLYGSYARGEADEGSDVDLLLLLDGAVDTTREVLWAEDVVWPLSLESGYTLSLLPVDADAYRNSEKPFLRNARKEGMSVA